MCFANGMAVNAAINGFTIVFGGALLVAFVLVVVGFVLSRSKKLNTRITGATIGLIAFSIPFVCCLSFVNWNNRSKDRDHIKQGMTKDEVLKILGKPDSKSSQIWNYYDGPTKLLYFGVVFDDQGFVKGTYSE